MSAILPAGLSCSVQTKYNSLNSILNGQWQKKMVLCKSFSLKYFWCNDS